MASSACNARKPKGNWGQHVENIERVLAVSWVMDSQPWEDCCQRYVLKAFAVGGVEGGLRAEEIR